MASQNDINSIPKKYIPVPFANSAESAFVNDIPQARASGDPQNKASWNLGFPPITMQPVDASGTGGIPPSGADMNGVLNALSSHAYIAQYGVSYDWDSNIASNLGGYPSGAIVAYPVGSNPNKTLYLSLQENNTSEPNTSAWKKLFQNSPMYIIDHNSRFENNVYRWWTIYSNNWVVQGGRSMPNQNEDNYNITFPIPFANKNYSLIVSASDEEYGFGSGGNVNGVEVGVGRVSATGFYIGRDSGYRSNQVYYWQASGYRQ